jgi:nucleoside-diphosphate-sugar epimerase
MRVLIGSTGFVGATLADQVAFDVAVHRPTLESVRGVSADLVVCAGMPAAKWAINQDPVGDRENMLRLMDVVGSMAAERFLLISTIDVYGNPAGVDESVPADLTHPQAYGRHRAVFEAFVRETFPQALILRLPGLFGRRLRKNLVFDLLQGADDQYLKVNGSSSFQFFDVARTWEVAQAGFAAGVRLLNVATEPVTAQSVADLFGVQLPAEGAAVAYDMHTSLGQELGMGLGPYLFSRDDELSGIAELRAAWTGPLG